MGPPKVVWYCRYAARADYPRKELCRGCRIPKGKCPGLIKYPRAKEPKR